jgi:quinol monooxygenase YgiN
MVVEYIRYKVTPEQKDTFIQSYKNASEQLDASAFCLAYELAECEEEPGQFILRIEWTSSEEHMLGFRKSAEFPAFFDNVKSFFNNIQEMRHYTVTEVLRRKAVLPKTSFS